MQRRPRRCTGGRWSLRLHNIARAAGHGWWYVSFIGRLAIATDGDVQQLVWHQKGNYCAAVSPKVRGVFGLRDAMRHVPPPTSASFTHLGCGMALRA